MYTRFFSCRICLCRNIHYPCSTQTFERMLPNWNSRRTLRFCLHREWKQRNGAEYGGVWQTHCKYRGQQKRDCERYAQRRRFGFYNLDSDEKIQRYLGRPVPHHFWPLHERRRRCCPDSVRQAAQVRRYSDCQKSRHRGFILFQPQKRFGSHR